MRIRTWRSAVLLIAVALGAGACRQTVTHPIYQRPVISSVVAFPTVLAVGDSTMITVSATDPDGDELVYDWEGYNGLQMKGPYGMGSTWYNRPSPSMVFYRVPYGSTPIETSFVWCSARDQRGGSMSRQVLILYKN